MLEVSMEILLDVNSRQHSVASEHKNELHSLTTFQINE